MFKRIILYNSIDIGTRFKGCQIFTYKLTANHTIIPLGIYLVLILRHVMHIEKSDEKRPHIVSCEVQSSTFIIIINYVKL